MIEIQHEISYKIIQDKNQLALFKESILNLFERSFQKKLSAELWEWSYINNVCGDPVVSLAFDQERLIGHYAVIPLRLKNSHSHFKSCLSMTTMVDLDYRGRGLFVTQAKQVYHKLIDLNYDMVIGFPNSNSAHGFKKHLGWHVNEPSEYMITVTKKQLAQSYELPVAIKTSHSVGFDVSDSAFLQWRLSKPGQVYEKVGSSIVKKFQDAYDIVYLGQDYLHDLNDNDQYNLFIDSNITDLLKYKVADYHYGYRCFSTIPHELIFKKDLLLSDVF